MKLTLQSQIAHQEDPPGIDRDALVKALRQAVDDTPGPPSFRGFLWHLLETRLLSHVEPEGLGLLPSLTCWACGRTMAEAASVTAAWQVVRLSAKILDDVEDEQCAERAGPFANAAVALLILAQLILQQSPLSKAQSGQLVAGLQQALLNAAAGQHVDLMTRADESHRPLDPEGWLDVAQAKTGALLAWAAGAGAIAASASDSAAEAYASYGQHLGILLQLADDFNDAWSEDLQSDLTHAQLNLAVTYALWVGSDSQLALLRSLLSSACAGSMEALVSARELLIDMGAQAYFVTVAELQRQNAAAALKRTEICLDEGRDLLLRLLSHTFPNPLERRPE